MWTIAAYRQTLTRISSAGLVYGLAASRHRIFIHQMNWVSIAIAIITAPNSGSTGITTTILLLILLIRLMVFFSRANLGEPAPER